MQRARETNFRNSMPQRGRNRGGRGRFQGGRGGGSASGVPSTSQVTSGGFVSIVLKADQGTDREVQGVVQDVLTSGNHPRGIKVRLQDGRVGRVQRMVSEGTAMAGSEGLSGLGENGEAGGRGGGRGGGRNQRYDRGESDRRDDIEPPRPGYSLEDFLPVGHPLRTNGATREETRGDGDSPLLGKTEEVQVCPVCGEFSGDETAVSHHVNGHFDDS
jgi:uncharacterized repeat protein (TIGR03833 family)